MSETSGRPSPLRGRAYEVSLLLELRDAARRRRGGALVLRGAAGTGKTALLRGIAAEAAGFTVLATSGTEREMELPFAGLQRLVHPVLDRADALPDVQARALTQALHTGEAAPRDRYVLFVAVHGLLCLIARDQPVLCCVDNAHWMDRLSVEALGFAARRLDAEPIAMLMTIDDAARAAEPIAGLPSHRLAGLDRHASHELLADNLPERLADGVGPALVTLASGNPGALVDLALALTPEQRRGEAPSPAALPPESPVRAAYQARLQHLPGEARWLLLLAAAEEELTAGELIRAARASNTGIVALEPAELAGLVRVTGNELTFPQPLVRSVVYAQATFAQRQAAHRLLAQILDPVVHPLRHALHVAAVTEGPDDELARRLHRAASGSAAGPVGGAAAGVARRSIASRALERAAELATAPTEAAQYLIDAARLACEGGEPYRARLLLRRIPQSATSNHMYAQSEMLLGEIELRAGVTGHARRALLAAAGALETDRDLSLSAMLRAGEAFCLSGEYQRFGALAERAMALRRPRESPGSQLIFEQFAGMAAMFRRDYENAVAPLRRVLSLAESSDDAVALARGGMAGILLGDDAKAHALAVRAAAVARTAGAVWMVPHALELAAAAQFALGRYAAATSLLLEGVDLARSSGQESLASSQVALLAVIRAIVGDREGCLARIREASPHTAACGLNRSEALIDWALGVLHLAHGRPAQALARLLELTGSGAGRRQHVIVIAATPHLVEAAVRVGERAAATAAIDVFEPWALSTGNPSWLALAERCRALVAECERQAEEHYRLALEHHAAAESDFERARTELLYGQELRRGRRPSQAREHLRRAMETFQRFGAGHWTEYAEAELRAAGDQVTQRGIRPADVLTPQQLQIARLAAGGATNREVAAVLVLSTRTVDHHMRNILARLGIRSRIELARLIT